MADFIETPTSGPAPTEFIPPAQQAEMANQAGQAAQPLPTAPQGVPQGAGMGATQEDPIKGEDQPASPEEEEQYKDLFTRVMSAVNDIRKPKGGEQSPADAVIKLMSVKGKEAHVAIGTAAGMVMMQITDMAQRAGVKYDGPIVQEVGIDLVVELTEIAALSGAIENMPEEESEEYGKLVELSALEAAKMYGEWQLRTGQADQQGHMNEIEQQMQREADAGELDNWEMEELDPKMRQQVLQSMQGGRPVAQAQQGAPPPQGMPPQGMPPQGGQ